jgi:hypothetical protein
MDVEKKIKDRTYDSKYVEVYGEKYCRYCGQEMREMVVHGDDDETFDYCDCEDAKEEVRLWNKVFSAEEALRALNEKGEKNTNLMFEKWNMKGHQQN